MIIRRERAADRPAIDEVLALAFADQAPAGTTPGEVALTRELFASAEYLPELSLVAEVDGTVVGFVLGTRGWVGEGPADGVPTAGVLTAEIPTAGVPTAGVPAAGVPAIGVGPLAVHPSHQGIGVGQALMRSVIAAADALDEPLIALLGSHEYYPRFGFGPASSLGVDSPDPDWGPHFQALALSAHRPDITGRFQYAGPFGV